MNIVKNLVSQSKYSVKCPYSMTPEFIVVHNTANDATAQNEVKYMIMSIDDAGIRVVDTSKRESVAWDDRYNVDKQGSMGINDYVSNNINSRIKDTLEEIYKNEIKIFSF